MTPEELQAIRARCEAATPGPWWWAEDFFRTKHMQRTRTGNWKARPGCDARDTHVMLLLGSRYNGGEPPDEPEYDYENKEHRKYDEYDYKRIIALRWSQVKGKSLVNAAPGSQDAAFLAHARDDIPALLDEIERLQAAVAAQREACAKVAEAEAVKLDAEGCPEEAGGCRLAAQSIRAGGSP